VDLAMFSLAILVFGLIVSPLLALMRNQIDMAARLGIRALTINSTNQSEWAELQHTILSDGADAILISPERLANEAFNKNVLLPIANRLGLLVVDEAHCISDWGHDFRPDYRLLVNVLKRMPPNMPILGTTATANNRVLEDVRRQLGEIQIQRGALTRETLALQMLRLPDQAARLAWLAEHLPRLDGTGISYTLTRRDALQVTEWLKCSGIDARAYFSDVTSPDFPDSNTYRQFLESELLDNQLKVLVATTALGMGYDKPDLAFVIHYQAPGSVVAYYQQVGRAGRAIDRAVGVLLAGREDAEIQEFFRTSAFPSERHVTAVLDALSRSDGLSVTELERRVNLRHGQIEKVLKYLSVESPSPVIFQERRWQRTPVRFVLDHAHIQRLTAQREEEWRQLQEYIDANGCLMAFLAGALDDPSVVACGRCANCLGQDIVQRTYSPQLGVTASRFLRQAEFPLELRSQIPAGALPEYGYSGRLPRDLRADAGRVLSLWGDAGWGHMVAEGKHAGRFSDELAEAVVAMVRDRWRPQPRPTWVTCVPSLAHPNLVPDLARRVAAGLRIPFVSAIKKVRGNLPQKLQENSFYQCSNLDGAFEVTAAQHEPVLLLDDVVDSRWTLTVVAALLRQAGVEAVFPVALAAATAE